MARIPANLLSLPGLRDAQQPLCETNGLANLLSRFPIMGRDDMAEDILNTAGLGRHGATRLPSVDVDSFNVELKDDDGFLGDRASKGAFRKIFDRWRKPLRKSGEDPFGDVSSDKISKAALDDMLIGDDTEASAVVHSAIEEFAQELAHVTRRFLKTKAWART